MALRNIYVSFDEESAKSLMSGELDVEYTGKVHYNMHRNENGEIFYRKENGEVLEPNFSPSDGDVFYGCGCEFKEIKSFKKVSKIRRLRVAKARK